jgi:hypothetical protein
MPRKAGLVVQITSKTRDIIELCESMRAVRADKPPISSEKAGLIDLAQQTFEQAAMYAVEAAKL